MKNSFGRDDNSAPLSPAGGRGFLQSPFASCTPDSILHEKHSGGLFMGSSKILVTGATGVVGRRLVPILIREGHSVVATTHGPGNRETLEKMGVATVAADF